MLANQDELNKPIQNNMIINIIGSNYLHESIVSNCLDINEGEYSGRVRIMSLLNTESLIVKTKNINGREEQGYGLLNMDWVKKTISSRPATIILVYDLRNKPESISWKDFENSIYSDINKIKKMDNYPFVNILTLIFSPPSFNFDNVNEDKDRVYAIKKILEPKNLHYIPGSDALKSIAKKLSSHIIKITVNYYRQIKKNLKIKKNNSNEIREKMIKYNIKLGIISCIKNKKRSSKYFEEAYNILSGLTLDLKNYYYSNNVRTSYLEVKQVADWLFFRIFYLKCNESNNFGWIVNIFNLHMQNFSKIEFLLQNNTNTELIQKFDKFFVIEYNWRIQRYSFIAKFLEDNCKLDFYYKSHLNFPGYYYMLSSFNCSRLINLINLLNFDSLMQGSKTDQIKIKESKYFGKVPRFLVEIDPLTEKEIEFNEDFYLKMYMVNNFISLNNLENKLIDDLNNAQKLYLSYLNKNNDNSSMLIYFHTLQILNNIHKEKETFKQIYKSIITSPHLNKFPLLFLKYLEEYNQILINESLQENNTLILFNLNAISSIRELNSEEQE